MTQPRAEDELLQKMIEMKREGFVSRRELAMANARIKELERQIGEMQQATNLTGRRWVRW